MRHLFPTLLIAAVLLNTDAVAQVPGFPKLPQLPGAAKQQVTSPPANQPAGKGYASASIATDARCDHIFETTGPMTALADGAKDALTDAMNGGTSPEAMRDRFNVFSRTKTWLPIEVEEKLGAKMAGKLPLLDDAQASAGRKAAEYAATREAFAQIVAALPPDTGYKFQLRFNQDDAPNLQTLPGGTVIVNTGMLKKDNGLLVQALLAHEIAHVLKRHYTRQIQGYIADTATVSDVMKVVGRGRSDGDKAMAWFGDINYLDQLFKSFYADQELEADACIPRLLKAANYPIAPAADAFQAWALSLANNNAAPQAPFEMRHPPSAQRTTTLAASVRYWSTRDRSGPSAITGQANESPSALERPRNPLQR